MLLATVQQNSINVQQANVLSDEAFRVTESGREVVQQVVSRMRDIAEASRKMSDIVGLMESITFQTNLLALNAAIEAPSPTWIPSRSAIRCWRIA